LTDDGAVRFSDPSAPCAARQFGSHPVGAAVDETRLFFDRRVLPCAEFPPELGEPRRVGSTGRTNDRALRYHRTFTAPDCRISPSRVMSGKSTLRAAAQMSASNGSRLNRISSAR